MEEGYLRRKVTPKEKRVLDKLVIRFESNEEKIKRVIDFLERLNKSIPLNSNTKKLFAELLNEPVIPLKDFKTLIGTQKISDVLKIATRIIWHSRGSCIDFMMPDNITILRLFHGGETAKTIFAISGKGGDFILRHLKSRKAFEITQGAQKILEISDIHVIEEFCGLTLEQLKLVAKTELERDVISRIYFEFTFPSRAYKVFNTYRNVTYHPLTKEIVVIDKA